MTGNRVEELEGEVQELRATVSGLTDELVETKERLRLIEDHFGPELDDIISGKVTRTEARSDLSGQANQPTQSQEGVDASASTGDEEPDHATEGEAAEATPESDAEESADEAKAPEEEAEEESAGSDDIIVA